jgi:hypothetical protein
LCSYIHVDDLLFLVSTQILDENQARIAE